MLSEKLITDVIKYIESRVHSAEIIIDGKAEKMDILKTEVVGDILKIFTNATQGKGTISDINIKDKDGNIIISKPDSILKTTGYSLVAAFYIKVKEVEVTDPINIFNLMEDKR